MTVDYKNLTDKLKDISKQYAKAKPYPHIVLDGYIDHSYLNEVLKAFPKIQDEGWIHYIHINEKKHGLNKLELIPKLIKEGIIKELNSPKFISFLEQLTGIKNLIPDHTFEGGGIHQSENGGYLNIHADFTVHPHKKNWRRRVNVLVYLNKNWKEGYGGALELWEKDMSQCVKNIQPIFNRMVIFNTDEDSYHGFPEPLTCPKDITRKSIALYYFTEEEKGTFKRKSTNYRSRPSDGFKSVLIWLDKKVIALYSWLKGCLGINDDAVSKLLNFLNRKKK